MTDLEFERLKKGERLRDYIHYDEETIVSLKKLEADDHLTLEKISNLLYHQIDRRYFDRSVDYRPSVLLREVARYTLQKCIRVYEAEVENNQQKFKDL